MKRNKAIQKAPQVDFLCIKPPLKSFFLPFFVQAQEKAAL